MIAKHVQLAPLSKGEFDVWVTVCVILETPLRAADDPHQPEMVGYFRNFGIRMSDRDPRRRLEQLINDGRIDWSDTEYSEVDSSQLDLDVRREIVPPDESGVWYCGPRMLFPAENSAA